MTCLVDYLKGASIKRYTLMTTGKRQTLSSYCYLIALCGILTHILLNAQYGLHRDELDVIMNARRLDWVI